MKNERVKQVELVAAGVSNKHGARLDEITEAMLARALTDAERQVLEVGLLFGATLAAVELLAGVDRLQGRRK